jgi:hypothetical protein
VSDGDSIAHTTALSKWRRNDDRIVREEEKQNNNNNNNIEAKRFSSNLLAKRFVRIGGQSGSTARQRRSTTKSILTWPFFFFFFFFLSFLFSLVSYYSSSSVVDVSDGRCSVRVVAIRSIGSAEGGGCSRSEAHPSPSLRFPEAKKEKKLFGEYIYAVVVVFIHSMYIFLAQP